MTNAAAINRKTIMQTAWERTRHLLDVIGYAASQMREIFAEQLRKAWAKEKAQVALLSRSVSSLKCEIEDLENSTRLNAAGREMIDTLRGAIRRIEAAEEAANFAEKRELIESAGGRFASVSFIKKDGTERTMKVQPAKLKFHIKGEDASEAAQRAVATRKANNPHLFNVWDVEAQAVRSVNLATIQIITVDGQAHAYAA